MNCRLYRHCGDIYKRSLRTTCYCHCEDTPRDCRVSLTMTAWRICGNLIKIKATKSKLQSKTIFCNSCANLLRLPTRPHKCARFQTHVDNVVSLPASSACAIHCSTYEFLSLSVIRLYRRYSCGNGHGRGYGYHSLAGAGRGRGTKNCPERQPVFFSAHEYRCAENARGQRAAANKGRGLGNFARSAFLRAGDDACRSVALRPLKACVRGVSNRAFVRRILSRVSEKDGLTKPRLRAIIPL